MSVLSEQVTKLSPKSGDFLVIHVDRGSGHVLEQIRDELVGILPEGVRAIVLEGDSTLELLTRGQIEALLI